MRDNLDQDAGPVPQGAESSGLNVMEWDSLCRGLPLAEQDIDRVLTTLLDGTAAAELVMNASAPAGGSWLSDQADAARAGHCPEAWGGTQSAIRYACSPEATSGKGEAAARRQAMLAALTACVAQIAPRQENQEWITTLFDQTFLPVFWRELKNAGGGQTNMD